MVEPIRLGVKTEQEMLADGTRLRPIVSRIVALQIAIIDRDDDDSWDNVPYDSVPSYLALSRHEREFVRLAAWELYSDCGADEHLADLVYEWFSDQTKWFAETPEAAA